MRNIFLLKQEPRELERAAVHQTGIPGPAPVDASCPGAGSSRQFNHSSPREPGGETDGYRKESPEREEREAKGSPRHPRGKRSWGRTG